MEPLTIFASTVGFIGAFHLLSTTVESLRERTAAPRDEQGKREDWYCFFQPSDLLGDDWGTAATEDQPRVSDTLEQRRRRQANRPRLRA